MALKLGIILFLTLGSTAGPQLRRRPASQGALGLHVATGHENDAVLTRVRLILRATKSVGIMYYSGSCQTEGLVFVRFPTVVVHTPKSNSAVRALREMFEGDVDVKVTRDKSEITSITIGQPSTTLLQTKISVLRIAPMAAYNPAVAIGAIEGATEVQSALAKLGLQVPLQPSEQLLAKPSPGLPHLPPVMRDVTAGQLLDSVAVTFRGLVTYGTCTQPNGKGLVEIHFIGLD